MFFKFKLYLIIEKEMRIKVSKMKRKLPFIVLSFGLYSFVWRSYWIIQTVWQYVQTINETIWIVDKLVTLQQNIDLRWARIESTNGHDVKIQFNTFNELGNSPIAWMLRWAWTFSNTLAILWRLSKDNMNT